MKELPADLTQYAEDYVVLDSDIQFASRSYQDQKAEVRIAEDLVIGGEGNSTWLMTGPCSVESKAQIETIAALCKTQDVRIIRGGCYKPRTSPYSFQGLGLEGLQILREVADARPRQGACGAVELLLYPRHDFEERRLQSGPGQ